MGRSIWGRGAKHFVSEEGGRDVVGGGLYLRMNIAFWGSDV